MKYLQISNETYNFIINCSKLLVAKTLKNLENTFVRFFPQHLLFMYIRLTTINEIELRELLQFFFTKIVRNSNEYN